jgi:asparagine synthase (glutamine-hydrolysing)
MCGIFALINNTSSIDNDVISYSFKQGVSRGPEYSELKYVNDKVIFGFHRLAINGLDSISNQPMTIDNITLICNGEIYNFKELYKMLNIKAKTNSDCEVIIHMYKKFGIEYTLRCLDGYFSFILIDNSNVNEEPSIYVGRDPYGVRPLFILKTNNCERIEYINKDNETICKEDLIGFASDLKSLSPILNYRGKRIIYNENKYNNTINVINNYYNYTIEQYPPGTYSKLSKKSVILSYYYFEKYCIKYTTFPLITDYMLSFSYQYIFNQVYSSLYDAVKKRVVGTTNRKIACLLSGGLDSSLITCLVSKFFEELGIKNELETYSIGLPGGEDLKYARCVAKHIGSKHTEIIVSDDDFFNTIPEVIFNIESYDTTTVRASVGNYLISKYIANNSDAKVIFNGDGSDELTGGYLYFHACPDEISFDKECKRLLKNINYFDVLRSDKSISSNGLEPRTPFLDSRFVQSYLSIPIEYRYKPNKPEKWLLRKSVEFCDPGLMPSEVLWRTKEAFSDGVSSQNKSWYEIIKDKVESLNFNLNSYDKNTFNCPKTVEQIYYRTLFDSYFPNCDNVIPYFWMPNFVDATDASARTLKLYKSKILNSKTDEQNIERELSEISLS